MEIRNLKWEVQVNIQSESGKWKWKVKVGSESGKVKFKGKVERVNMGSES